MAAGKVRKAASAPNPVLVDDRVGSRELAAGIPGSRLQRLRFGDFAFFGNGRDGERVLVGIERKEFGDWVSSCASGRLTAHQLPGLVAAYTVVYVVIEGYWRAAADGSVLVWKAGEWRPHQGRTLAAEIIGREITLREVLGIRVLHTTDADHTARLVTMLHRWWTGREWADHRSHVELAQPPEVAHLVRPSVAMKVAACLPGIGWKRAQAVVGHFGSIEAMATAEAGDWEAVPGIGKTTARKVVEAFNNGRRAVGDD